ncbi:MAG: hypothetical protein ACRED9_02180 [Caulobacteraceae bacterium]
MLLFDGVFLLRAELFEPSDLRIFLRVSFEEAMALVCARGHTVLRSVAEVERRYRNRYIPFNEHYPRPSNRPATPMSSSTTTRLMRRAGKSEVPVPGRRWNSATNNPPPGRALG